MGDLVFCQSIGQSPEVLVVKKMDADNLKHHIWPKLVKIRVKS